MTWLFRRMSKCKLDDDGIDDVDDYNDDDEGGGDVLAVQGHVYKYLYDWL